MKWQNPKYSYDHNYLIVQLFNWYVALVNSKIRNVHLITYVDKGLPHMKYPEICKTTFEVNDNVYWYGNLQLFPRKLSQL